MTIEQHVMEPFTAEKAMEMTEGSCSIRVEAVMSSIMDGIMIRARQGWEYIEVTDPKLISAISKQLRPWLQELGYLVVTYKDHVDVQWGSQSWP